MLWFLVVWHYIFLLSISYLLFTKCLYFPSRVRSIYYPHVPLHKGSVRTWWKVCSSKGWMGVVGEVGEKKGGGDQGNHRRANEVEWIILISSHLFLKVIKKQPHIQEAEVTGYMVTLGRLANSWCLTRHIYDTALAIHCASLQQSHCICSTNHLPLGDWG